MTATELAEMQRMIDELGTKFCRRCGYCEPCSQEITIPILMTFPTFVKRLPPDWYLKSPWIPQVMEKATTCIECGECEPKCPQDIPIRERLKEVAAALGS